MVHCWTVLGDLWHNQLLQWLEDGRHKPVLGIWMNESVEWHWIFKDFFILIHQGDRWALFLSCRFRSGWSVWTVHGRRGPNVNNDDGNANHTHGFARDEKPLPVLWQELCHGGGHVCWHWMFAGICKWSQMVLMLLTNYIKLYIIPITSDTDSDYSFSHYVLTRIPPSVY